MSSEWKSRKKYFIERLREEFEAGRVDPDIKALLDLINEQDDFYTTSSCSGRIQVAEVRMLGEKFKIRVLGKWHWKVDASEVMEAIKLGENYVWFMVQSPIVHIVARDLEKALWMLSVARFCGFKHSGIQVVKEGRVLVEVIGSENMHVPVIWRGKWVIPPSSVEALVRIGNELLERGKLKLRKFEEYLRREFSCHFGRVTPRWP